MSKILLVDDNQSALKSLAACLANERPEWLIFTSSTVQDAKKHIAETEFDLIVTDWRFDKDDPNGGKHILLTAIKRDPTAKVIVVTAYAERFDRYEEAFRNGAFDIIEKGKPHQIGYKEICLKGDAALKLRNSSRDSLSYSRHLDVFVAGAYRNCTEKLKFQRRLLSIVFCDLRGFSAVNKSLLADNELVADFLRCFYELIARICHRHNGVVDKFLGDGALLLFGALKDCETGKEGGDEDAVFAAHAALDLREEILPLFEHFQGRFNKVVENEILKLEIGIGINTSEVFSGVLSTSDRDQFTAIGHGVNVAQRFEAAAGRPKDGDGVRGRILVSKTVQTRINKKFHLIDEGLISPKNMPPLPAWSIVSAKEQDS